jgi:glycosyltransferase involved in cell wall biosynthesis
MRIGALWYPTPNSAYRAIDPLRAMERRGHEIVWPDPSTGHSPLAALVGCDLVHVYRFWENDIVNAASELRRRGTAITWDNDDDYTVVNPKMSTYAEIGGLKGERIFLRMLKIARLAEAVTTTTPSLAERYRRAGIEGVTVIPNHLSISLPRPTERHDGVVIGWIAGAEHELDARELGIHAALRRVLEDHPEVRVESVGVELDLPAQRYRHHRMVPFAELPRVTARFDIGIAPLADIPFNRARSDIKLKEYAASGVPWLASPVGPYLGLGEDEGGGLVADGAWEHELRRLVADRRARRRLAKRATRWAKGQTIESAADAWAAVFAGAVESRRQAA